MKSILLIVSMMLSCLFSGGGRAAQVQNTAGAVVKTAEQKHADSHTKYNTMGLAPQRTARFSGEDNTVSPSVRSTNSARRIQPSTKSAFRLVKAGKTIDRQHFRTFLTTLGQFQSGIHSTSRYIHAICHLLI